MSARATAFLIWRAGSSVNWDCTAQEIADEIGMTFNTVSNVCKQRGWSLVPNRNGHVDRYAVDSIMKSPYMQAHGIE